VGDHQGGGTLVNGGLYDGHGRGVQGVGQGDVADGAACGDDACVVCWGVGAASAGADSGASWIAEEPADGEGTAEADSKGAAETGTALVRTARGAAAAPWPPPSATARTMPVPVKARTATKATTPDRKLISSMRAFITRLSLAAQPVPSLTTKHDTGVSAVLVGGGGSEALVALFGQLAGGHDGFGISGRTGHRACVR